MKLARFLVLIVAVGTTCLLLTTGALAQGGCGATINSNTISCCGNDNHPNQDCNGSGGDPNNFCFVSFGNCCGVDYTLANVRLDPKCSPIGSKFGGASYRPGVLPPGSCSGHHVAGEMLSFLEPLASRGEFVIRERLNFEVKQ